MTVFPVLLIYLITNFFQVNFAIIPKKIAYFEEIIKLEYINFNIKGKLTSNIFARALNSRVARKLMEKISQMKIKGKMLITSPKLNQSGQIRYHFKA